MSNKSEKRPNLTGMRILYVEDDPSQRRDMAYFLIQAGAEMTLENDGQGALELITSNTTDNVPFDLMLIDVDMPILNGCETTRQLREAGYDLPIVAISGLDASTWRRKCLDAGCNEYLAKPIAPGKLFDRLRQLCPADKQIVIHDDD